MRLHEILEMSYVEKHCEIISADYRHKIAYNLLKPCKKYMFQQIITKFDTSDGLFYGEKNGNEKVKMPNYFI